MIVTKQTDDLPEQTGMPALIRGIPYALVYPFSALRPVALLIACFCWPMFWCAYFGLLCALSDATPGRFLLLYFLVVFSPLFLLAVPLTYLLHLVERSATGDARLPGWPRIDDLGKDLLYPILRVLLAYFVSVLPVLLYAALAAEPRAWILRLLWATVALYFPMAVLAVTMHGRFEAALPHVVIPAVFRAAPAALGLAGAVWLLKLAHGGAVDGVLMLLFSVRSSGFWWLVFCLFLLALADYYLCAVAARMLGITYQAYRGKLGWFERD